MTGATATATSCAFVRIDLNDPEWFQALPLLSPLASEVGRAFVDMRTAADIDEEVLCADSLVVLDDAPNHNRTELMIAVAAVFRSDIVAMIDSGDHEAASRSFERIPGTRAAMLPFYFRH